MEYGDFYGKNKEAELIREMMDLGDDFPYKEAAEVLGINRLMQLESVIPGFCEKLLIIKLFRSEDKEGILDPVVVASPIPEYKRGDIVSPLKELPKMIGCGSNVTVSPREKRIKFRTGLYELTHEVYDTLVIAEVDPEKRNKKNPWIFHGGDTSLKYMKIYGDTINSGLGDGEMHPIYFNQGLANSGIHFAFTKGDSSNHRSHLSIHDDFLVYEF